MAALHLLTEFDPRHGQLVQVAPGVQRVVARLRARDGGDAGTIDALFRSVHTLKGSSGLLDLAVLAARQLDRKLDQCV